MSEVYLEIPMDSLHDLPNGAIYEGRSGQAGVKVSRKVNDSKETIYVYASCDSLQLQCEEYERKIEAWRKAWNLSDSQKAELKQPSNDIGTALKWFFIGVLVGGVITIVVITKIKKK